MLRITIRGLLGKVPNYQVSLLLNNPYAVTFDRKCFEGRWCNVTQVCKVDIYRRVFSALLHITNLNCDHF